MDRRGLNRCLALALFAALAQGCASHIDPAHVESRPRFSTLDIRADRPAPWNPTDNYSLTLLVDAKGFDYSTPRSLIRTMSRHPRGDAAERSVGHAWLILRDALTWFECGHTGQFGLDCPVYREHVESALKSADPNPLSCLWSNSSLATLEHGSGGHVPTTAVEFAISQSEFTSIREFIEHYAYDEFCPAGRVCTDFVTGAARQAGIDLGHQVTLDIPQHTPLGGGTVRWWTDPRYSRVTFGSPDVLERSLKLAAKNGLGRKVTSDQRRRAIAHLSSGLAGKLPYR